jgi:hypothetical protein
MRKCAYAGGFSSTDAGASESRNALSNISEWHVDARELKNAFNAYSDANIKDKDNNILEEAHEFTIYWKPEESEPVSMQIILARQDCLYRTISRRQSSK